MSDVSQYDEDRPDPDPDGARDLGDTQPLHPTGPSYPPPYGHQAPPPVAPQPPAPPAAPPTVPMPYGYQQQPPRPAPTPAAPTSRFPGWAWPVMTVLALVVGMLGGVITSLAVSNSLDSTSGGAVKVIGTDSGAAAPLKADNGSVSAVAAKLLPSTVQIQAKGGADGTKHAAKIIGRSPVYDIAVLDVSGASGLRPAAIGSSARLRVGDTVVAIGSPLGLSSTVTSGIVSATDRPVTTGNNTQSSYINALQTDAAINPGNSGGPLVNMRGQVIGVNSAIATTGGAIGGESGNIGVGFAIPMEQVRVTATQILATGKARYPVIGASVNTGAAADGAEVSAVPSGTPASHAGLKKGDVVTGVDGKQVTDGIGLIVAIRSHQPGEVIDLRVRRSGHTQDVKVRLDSKVG